MTIYCKTCHCTHAAWTRLNDGLIVAVVAPASATSGLCRDESSPRHPGKPKDDQQCPAASHA